MTLGIETSASACNVALYDSGQILAEYTSHTAAQHASVLGKFVEDIPLRHKKKITLVAVATGPGSFTGLRIGLSFAQGFCFGRNIPLVGVSNHQLLASQIGNSDGDLYSVIDAHRDELYLARHKNNPLFEIECLEIIESSKLDKVIPATAQLACAVNLNLKTNKINNLTRAEFKASHLAELGLLIFKTKGADEPQKLQPLYIRPFAGVQ
jgi:tRNA threonylcarbamoyladenosine biosynthesis protein TsaB